MDFKTELATTIENMGKYQQVQPEGAAGFNALHKAALLPGKLSVKDKELIALAIGISRQCADCIGLHVKAAIAAGADRDEIGETVSVAILMGGGPSYMYGARAMEAYDQLA